MAVETTAAPDAGPEVDGAAPKRRSSTVHDAPAGSTTGWIVKIALLGLADALAVAGLLIAWDNEAWGYVAVLVAALVLLNIAYLPRRFVPMKYLLPGLLFLALFGVYPVLYTAYASTTNYGTGFVLSREQAIAQIQSQSVSRSEDATAYDATPLRDGDGFVGYGLYDPETEELFLGTTDGLEPLDDAAELQELTTTGRTFVVGVGDLEGVRPGDVRTLPGFPADPDAFSIPADDGGEIRISGGQAFEQAARFQYDVAQDALVDADTGVVYTERQGQFVAPDGESLTPGFTTGVGFDNYVEVLTGAEYRGSFLRVLVWNIAFAALSVVTAFGFGLLLASLFNDERMRGRRIYRSLIIVPYALPAFMTALVWKALLNETYGVNRWLGLEVGWLQNTGLAMFSLILVNLWLGYPYMFLVCTGALQSIPPDLKEAAYVDGATGPQTFRKVTFPLLLTAVSPLLVASFAFNFNNFTLVYLLTSGGPRSSGESAGSTDLLLTWTYRIALDGEPKQQGLAAALSVVIFLIVGLLGAIGFKYTKTFEEVR